MLGSGPVTERGSDDRHGGIDVLHYLTDHGRALVAACESAVRVTLEERLGSLSGANSNNFAWCWSVSRVTPVLFRPVKERN